MTTQKAQLSTIQKLLSSLHLQGNLSEMLRAGLPHALEEKPEDRHPMQEVVLKMSNEVLGSAQNEAQAEEAARRSEADAAQIELETLKAAANAASEALAAAKAVVSEKKAAQGECKQAVAAEEHHHKKAEAEDKARAKIMAKLEKDRAQVAGLLASVDQKGSSKALQSFLESAEADIVVISSLPTVIAKEPSERTGFDLHVLKWLQDFLGDKVSALDAEMVAEIAQQADAHAEALGAFAILDLARDHMREATAGLRKAEAVVEAARESLKEANEAVEQQEGLSAAKRLEVVVAEDKARRCREALDLLKCLEAGPEVSAAPVPEEAPVPDDAPMVDTVMAPAPPPAQRAASPGLLMSPAVLLQSARSLLPSPRIAQSPQVMQAPQAAA